VADISKANKDFGYKPKVSLEQGVKKMWEWLNEQS
jgi:nucleoside-diphosphate-sugar epimerase